MKASRFFRTSASHATFSASAFASLLLLRYYKGNSGGTINKGTNISKAPGTVTRSINAVIPQRGFAKQAKTRRKGRKRSMNNEFGSNSIEEDSMDSLCEHNKVWSFSPFFSFSHFVSFISFSLS